MRTPGAIQEGCVATCRDTALLLAGVLEQAGLNPLLVLTKGHAFVGVWLQPVEFASLITDEAAALRRRIDLKELIVFETTLATQASPPGLSGAVKAATRLLTEDAADPFAAVIDVRHTRIQKIRSLSLIGVARETTSSEAVHEGGKDRFLHHSVLERSGMRDLQEGMRVPAKIVEGPIGTEAAAIKPA